MTKAEKVVLGIAIGLAVVLVAFVLTAAFLVDASGF